MNTYITSTVIKQLREQRGLTQLQLAEQISVSGKAVSKWETGKGLPDITLIEPLAKALGVSVVELMQGEQIVNRNTSGNVQRLRFYVCPICGNVLTGLGHAVVSCCGVLLPPLEAEDADEAHRIQFAPVEDEWFLTANHPMTKEHHLSFFALVTSDRLQLVKLYPEGNAEARFKRNGRGSLYAYCNRHGLIKQPL